MSVATCYYSVSCISIIDFWYGCRLLSMKIGNWRQRSWVWRTPIQQRNHEHIYIYICVGAVEQNSFSIRCACEEFLNLGTNSLIHLFVAGVFHKWCDFSVCHQQFRCTTLHSITLQFTTLHSTTLHSITIHYTALHYTTLYTTTLHSSTLHSATLHYTTLHYTTPHHTTLHYTTQYITLNCTTLHYN